MPHAPELSDTVPPHSARLASAGRDISRRGVLTAAGFSVPAIVAISATPAFASSSDRTITLVSPQMRVMASGRSPISATVTHPDGTPFAGATVSFSGPSGASFIPSVDTTDSDGVLSGTVDLGTRWATPGSTVAITVLSSAESISQPFTVTGSNVVGAGSFFTTSSTNPRQTDLVFPAPVVQAVSGQSRSSGDGFLVALLSDGTVWTVGDNSAGELGDGSDTWRPTWDVVPGLTGVVQIAAADATVYARRSDGTVAAWGNNASGQIGDGTTSTRFSPTDIPSLTNVTQIAALGPTAYALLSGGVVMAWGDNTWGQLGDGSTVNQSTPQPVALADSATQIAASSISAAAVLADGTVQAWGSNNFGDVGVGSTAMQTVPVTIDGLTGVKRLAGGFASFHAVLSDGSMLGWGLNTNGQLGDGTTVDRHRPVSVVGVTDAVSVSTGLASTFALLSDGSAISWGDNSGRVLGNGTNVASATPVTVIIPPGRRVTGLGEPAAGASALWITAAV